jgi:hypothetical protein
MSGEGIAYVSPRSLASAVSLEATVRSRVGVVARASLVFAAWLALVMLVQYRSGAYRIEAGVYSDDAAHLMNGLVIRDYLRTAIGQDPVAFAENYYLSYPKIAPLMWPPLFHVVLGILMLAGVSPGVTALLLVAALAAWLLWRLQTIVEQIAGTIPAVLASALTLSTPLVVALSSVVMLDIAIAAIGLEAVYWLARYAESGLRRHAVVFGVLAACACLTKGNGVAVVLTPLFFVLLTGRFDLFLSRGLYLAAAIVLVCAVPILAVSARFDAAIGDFGPVTPVIVLQRVEFYSAHVWKQFGPVLLTLSAIGLVLAIVWSRGRRGNVPTNGLVEAVLSLVIAGIVFHLFVPHRVAVTRYLTLVLAPLIGLASLAAWRIINPLSGRSLRYSTSLFAASAVAIAVSISRPAPQQRTPMGYRHVISEFASRGELSGARLLVVADEFGEGAFVTEAAVLGLQPAPMMIRGSKLLASDDWGGRFFKLRYPTAAALMKDLEDLHISYVLVDRSPSVALPPYADQIAELAVSSPSRLALARNFPADETQGRARSLTVYRVTSPSPGEAKPIKISLAYSIGKSLSK